MIFYGDYLFQVKHLSFYLLLVSFFSSNLKASNHLSAISFNTGLAHGYIPYAKNRREIIPKVLLEKNADIICLQEVWENKDLDFFKEKLAKKYPYSYFPRPSQKFSRNTPSCYPSDLIGRGKFLPCFFKNCLFSKGDKTSACIIDKCQMPLKKLKEDHPQCLQSMLSQVGTNPLKVIFNIFNPFSKSPLFAYKGGSGIILFSKAPFKEKRMISWQQYSTLTKREAIYAKILKNGRPQHLICTHLAANLEDTIPYPGQYFKSWQEENLFQAQDLLKFLKELPENETQLIMGDFNFGPSLPHHYKGELSKTYQNMINAKYNDPLISLKKCTFCKGNSLNAAHKNSPSLFIDHIFTKNISLASSKVQVLFARNYKIPLENGKYLPLPLSDHYGVFLRYQMPASMP